MIELLSTFTGTQLLIFLVMVMLAVKELITILEFFGVRVRGIFDKEYKVKDEQKEISEKLEEIFQFIEEYKIERKKLIKQVEDIRKEYRDMFTKQQQTLDTLIASDIEDIKSDIVKQYHIFTEKQWIDDFSMDALEKRYARYEEEGGNSYVHTLIDKLRQLPNQPPQ